MTDNDRNNKQAEAPKDDLVEIFPKDGEINAISDEKIDELWEQA